MKNKGIVMFTIVILLIIAGFFLLNSFLKKNVLDLNTVNLEKNSTNIIEESASLFVPQQASGTEVFIEKAFLPKGGYVVIHKEKDGKPGEVVGVSKLLKSGPNNNFTVEISKNSIEGDVFYAMLYGGNGDGKFDITTDKPTLDNSGNPVFIKFNIVKSVPPNKIIK